MQPLPHPRKEGQFLPPRYIIKRIPKAKEHVYSSADIGLFYDKQAFINDIFMSWGKFEIVAQRYISHKSYKASVPRVYRNPTNVYKVESIQNTYSIKDHGPSNSRFRQFGRDIVNEMTQYERLYRRKQQEAVLQQMKKAAGVKESLQDRLSRALLKKIDFKL